MNWKQLLVSLRESVDQELGLRNAYLATENRILRQQIHGRLQLSASDRRVLAAIGKQLGKKALKEIATVAKADTILAWHRRFVAQKVDSSKPHTAVGRPRIDQEIEDLVVRMARENRSWGYDRILGALANLGYTISDQTVGNILKRQSIPPAPKRKKTTTWKEFLRTHMDILVATTVITVEEQLRGRLDRGRRAQSDAEVVRAYHNLLATFLSFRTITIIDFDEQAQTIFQRLRTQSMRIGTLDLRIAASALSREATLVTRNRQDFVGIPSLNMEDWSLPGEDVTGHGASR